jgi:ApaG protein
MYNKTTNGIKINVITKYNKQISSPGNHFFNYTITIENHSLNEIKLIRRKWFITDSLNRKFIVEGIGVIGEQPELEIGEIFSYTSGTELKGEFGEMFGNYQFINIKTGDFFDVEIPKFKLEVPYALN